METKLIKPPYWILPTHIQNGAFLELSKELLYDLIQSGRIIDYFILPAIEKDALEQDFGYYDNVSGGLVKDSSLYKPNKMDAYFYPKKIAIKHNLDETRLIESLKEADVKSIEVDGYVFYSLNEFYTKDVKF